MDDLIKRIKARVSDPICFLDSASWVRPITIPAPPASASDVDAAEAVFGFAFPLLARVLPSMTWLASILNALRLNILLSRQQLNGQRGLFL